MNVVATALLVASVAACGSVPPTNTPPTAKLPALPDIMLVANERGPTGPRLVGIDRDGNRQYEMVTQAQISVRDANPAVSPDGKWLVFTSSRGGEPTASNLWLAAIGYEMPPRPLTAGSWVDTHPVWTPDGRGLVFASTRGGNFDLYHLALTVGERGLAASTLTQLTSAPTHEVTPQLGRGASAGRVVFAMVSGGAAPTSKLASVPLAGGVVTELTPGPGDSGPAFTPDGSHIVYTSPSVRQQSVDGDLYIMGADGKDGRVLWDVAGTDENGPVFSADGKALFATSLFRSVDGRVLFSSVIYALEPWGQKTPTATSPPPVVRMLIDRAGATERVSPALLAARPTAADLLALAQGPAYLPKLREIVAAAAAEQGVLP